MGNGQMKGGGGGEGEREKHRVKGQDSSFHSRRMTKHL